MTIYITPDEYDIAELNGISMKMVNVRVRERGWSKRRAITTPVRFQRKTEDDEWLALAEANGIPRYTYLRRVRDYDWSKQEAATRPVMTRDEMARNLNAKRSAFTQTHYKIMEQNGISRGVASNRYNTYGWTIEDAITIPVMSRSEASKFGRRKLN